MSAFALAFSLVMFTLGLVMACVAWGAGVRFRKPWRERDPGPAWVTPALNKDWLTAPSPWVTGTPVCPICGVPHSPPHLLPPNPTTKPTKEEMEAELRAAKGRAPATPPWTEQGLPPPPALPFKMAPFEPTARVMTPALKFCPVCGAYWRCEHDLSAAGPVEPAGVDIPGPP